MEHSYAKMTLDQIAKATYELTLQSWLAKTPLPIQDPSAAISALSHHTQCGEMLLAQLPSKPMRSPSEQCSAEKIHQSCRQVRTWFMQMHAIWLYDMLTNHKTIHKRLIDLVFDAADLCPGLVPTKKQIDQERQSLQIEKEGREIDQGIFFWGFLRVPEIGCHLIDAMLKPTECAQSLLADFRRTRQLNLRTIQVEQQNGAAYLTVNNKNCLNAEDDTLIEDMEIAVDLALLNDEVRVGVLRGAPMTHPRYFNRRVFSSGINLKYLRQGQISFVEFLLRRELGYINKILHGLLVEDNEQHWSRKICGKPWLAVVDSFAIGGGAQLLLVFDKVIASADSYFSLPAAQEGIIPGVANFRLGRIVGNRITRQVILGGRKIWAHEPDAKLLFDEVVDPAAMEAAIENSVHQLDAPAVKANRRMLNLAEEPITAFCAYMAEFALEQSQRLYSQDVLNKKWKA